MSVKTKKMSTATTTKGNLINENSLIEVYFSDLTNPEYKIFATRINDKLIVLKDESADMNDLEDVREMAVGYVKESNEESVYLNYYEVKNSSIGTPFTDEDIPEHFFDLGILPMPFEKIVNAAIAEANLESGVRGLFAYANDNATGDDKQQFIEWLQDELQNKRGLMDINTMTTKPVDHFESCEDMTWDELAEYYNDRY